MKIPWFGTPTNESLAVVAVVEGATNGGGALAAVMVMVMVMVLAMAVQVPVLVLFFQRNWQNYW